MKNIILIKENGKLRIEPKTPELTKEITKSIKDDEHLCWENCTNACAKKCSKIADMPKKDLNSYSFINSGIQIIDEKGEIENFIVSDCKKYQKATPKEYTPEEKARIRQASRELRKAYFDTITLEEAYIKQYELLERGDLINPRGKRPCSDEIRKIIQDKKRNKVKTRGIRKSY